MFHVFRFSYVFLHQNRKNLNIYKQASIFHYSLDSAQFLALRSV